MSGYFAIADYEGEVRQKFEKTLLRVGKLCEMGMPEEEITQSRMSEKFYTDCGKIFRKRK